MTSGNDFAALPSNLTVFHYAGGELQKDTLAGRFIQAVPSADALYFVVTDQSKQHTIWTLGGIPFSCRNRSLGRDDSQERG